MQYDKLSMSIHCVALAIIVGIVSPTAVAGIIWNEQSDGDLRPETDPTPLVIPVGEHDIAGIVGGDPNDPQQDAYDAFVFEVGPGEAWNQFLLVSHNPNPPNQSTGFVVYEGSNSTTGIFLNGIPAAGDNVDLFALMFLGPLGPGTYTVGIRDFESIGNLYQVRIGVVPEPAGWLFGTVLLLCAAALRKVIPLSATSYPGILRGRPC